MPIPLQKKKIRENLRKANPEQAEEVDFTEDFVYDINGDRRYWPELLEEGLSFEDNLSILEEEIPNVNWRIPKKQKEPRKSKEYIYKSPKGPVYCKESETVVRPLKGRIKGIRYEHGRVQITLPKELISLEAHVRVEVPNPPEFKKKVRRHKRALQYWQFDSETPEDLKKLEIRKARKEIRAIRAREAKAIEKVRKMHHLSK